MAVGKAQKVEVEPDEVPSEKYTLFVKNVG